MYGDPDNPDRVTRTISGPPYTSEDHALLAALRSYEDTLCPGCSLPIHEAWHSEMEGWYEGGGYVCHACTARQGHEVAYSTLTNTRPASKGPMPPFSLVDSTTKPTPPKSHT